MAIENQYEYVKAKNLDEVVGLLQRFKNAVILSGGTDLVELLKTGAVHPDVVIDIKGLDFLKDIRLGNNILWIGAGVTFSELIDSEIINEHFPIIAEMSKTVASVGIRNRATMVGNICSAVPCMDSGPVLSVYKARIITDGQIGERQIPIEQWFVGNRKTALFKNEIVKGISIPVPDKKHSGCFVKLRRYSGEDLAQVNLAILAFDDYSFRITFGAVAPTPVRAMRIERLINRMKLVPELMEKAQQLVEDDIAPITDIRATKEYRLHMAKVMLERGLNAALDRLNGGGPAYGKSVI
ncbi:MAG: xanthine dehydrogenase family protein subunit M [Ignavibacteriaceae bacterium]|nr:xanthine dehydrogenase family protein subunit M [Ignavibacteriaceae bacterium]